MKRPDPPVIEHEIDPLTFERTGRTRRSQWTCETIRRDAVPPSRRGDHPFVFENGEAGEGERTRTS